jgi:hypothetical protein
MPPRRKGKVMDKLAGGRFLIRDSRGNSWIGLGLRGELGRPGRSTRWPDEMGPQISGDHQNVDDRVAGVRAVSSVRPRNPADRVLHERHRKLEHSDPACGSCTRVFPERARSTQMYLPSVTVTRPDRQRKSKMGHPLETSTQRIRSRIRRMHQLMCTHIN